MKLDKKKLNKSHKQSFKGIMNMLPVIFGILLLVSIITEVVPESFYKNLFNGNVWHDSFIGDILGSVFTGNPITGYILGKELLNQGVSLVAVTAFLVSWVTVGLFQLPAEAVVLGKRFAFFRNITAFVMAAVVAVITTLIVNFF